MIEEIELEGKMWEETKLAILYTNKGSGMLHWIPRSQISYLWRETKELPTKVKIKVPLWLADKKKL